ncbi:MAG: hypothetical protein M1833_007298 [Piccolia ochrophora]|nr:MAG: hypothetical protein M1833_007298 [Piccolia ochrophora]
MRLPRLALGMPERSFFFSLLVVSLLTAKSLHVFSHLRTTAVFLFLLYFPTFFLPDLFVVCMSRLLFRHSRILSVALCLLITLASAAQIGLFIETGGELRWSMMGKILREPAGFVGMLMTGLFGTMLVTSGLVVVAWLLNPFLYNLAFRILRAFLTTLAPRRFGRWFRASPGDAGYDACPNQESEIGDEKQIQTSKRRWLWWARLKLAVFVGVLTILQVVRPSQPFSHMSTTLPFTLFEGIFFRRSAMCDPSPWDGPKPFPLADLIKEDFWTLPSKEAGGNGRGWRPGSPWWEVERARPYWLPHEEVPGFAKWYRDTKLPESGEPPHPPPESDAPPSNSEQPPPPPPPSPPFGGKHPFPAPPGPPGPPPPPGYESVLDPLKISNFDQALLPHLRRALKREKTKVPIKHVILMTLESTRKDIFPLVKDDSLYKQLEESRKTELGKRGDEWAELADLSRNAEFITGEDTNFGRPRNMTHGGLNVNGAITASSFTLKSLMAAYCGVGPLPVDFLEELETEVYQPCLPQILKVMNAQKRTPVKGKEGWPWTNGTWRSAFMQASTNKLDRQQIFIKDAGFDEAIYREDIQAPDAKFPVKEPELNYFGYSERALKPYIKDLFVDAEKKGERVFLSHLTSSTHHPWTTPEEFGPQKKYWGGAKGGGSAWDRYLNTIKFADEWVGEVLEILKEVGVADETLVVALGDHGFSFGDSAALKTTYANGDVKSFAIPMVFHHPSLPRIQLNKTVTQLSVLPTILDLLTSTNSLSTPQTDIVKDLIPEYEGQSLIRRFLPSHDGRQAWHFGVVNPGGNQLTVVSSAHPFRLVVPICETTSFTFSDLEHDPLEARSVRDWDGGEPLIRKVAQAYGAEAAKWVDDAEKVSRWYVWEARRRWGYWGGTRREDRGAAHWADGHLDHDHWWDT